MPRRRRHPALVLLATTALVTGGLTAGAGSAVAAPAPDKATNAAKSAAGVYIVRMAQAPAVAYAGGIAGYRATRPATGKKLDPNNADVKKYVAYLDGKHAAAANAVGATKFYDYRYSFNGFAAKLTPAQARKLAARADVAAVDADTLAKVETSTTPEFLGLTKPGGLWSQLGGTGRGGAGENVVIGIIDTGIWPEHPSFSDQTDLKFRTGDSGKRRRAYDAVPASWRGRCQAGEQFSQDLCTTKLIGARYFLSGFGHYGVVQHDYKSARDADGHGTHTASTAGGNAGVKAAAEGVDLGTISGMAPRARIAAYKVCWNGDAGGCSNSDSVAAIDTAVADGVDVLNFSISGTSTNYLDPVEVAFLFAEKAGVSVATSAGNSGPGATTVAHVSPWLSSVAASTHDRVSLATVTLGNGASYSGPSATKGVGSSPLVTATAAAASGADADEARLCFPGVLDPAKTAGKIVVCDRGVNDRTEKSHAVRTAGGVGMVLVNTSENSLNTDLHYVPTVHLDHVAGAAVKAYAATAGATAAISDSAADPDAQAPYMAAFSSRGPSLAGSGDVLKPDMTAPGVDIIAGFSPQANGRLFDYLSGTSMSSPHVAGVLALLRDRRPGWTPSAYKSALMTTGYDTLDGDPFGHGAGHITPNSAADPGLVYTASFNDYRAFLRGQGLCRLCFSPDGGEAGIIAPNELNLASLAVGKLAGTTTLHRRVTNVGAGGTYTATVDAPPGVDVVVTPASLTLAAGESKSFAVTFTTEDDATFDEYAFGHLTWNGAGHSVRSPLAIRPVRLAVPGEVSGTGTSGSVDVPVTFGYNGPFTVAPRGLVPATTTDATVADDPTNTFDPEGAGVNAHTVVIPAGTTHARFSTFDANTSGHGDDDLDLYVYDSEGNEVGSSAGGTAQEQVDLVDPAAGTYTVYVHGWQTAGPSTAYTLFGWVLGSTPAGNLTVSGAPATAVLGASDSFTAAWTGLTAGTKYLGGLAYSNGTDEIGRTLVRVDG